MVRGDLDDADSLTAADVSEHLRSRTAVGEILLESGIETVVLQAGIVVGSGSASFEMIRHLTDRLPVMTWVRNKIQPIAIHDVLHDLAEAAAATVPSSRTWDIGGPDVLEYAEAMQIYAEVAGLLRRLIVVLPVLTPTIASLWVGLVTPIPPGLARPLVESLECDAVRNEHDIDAVIPPPEDGLTGYRDAVSHALNHGPLPSRSSLGAGAENQRLRPAQRGHVVVVGLQRDPGAGGGRQHVLDDVLAQRRFAGQLDRVLAVEARGA